MPVRIFGPAKSTSTASGRFIFSAAARAILMSPAFSSCVPCDMLTRTPSTPAANSASITFGLRDDGPSVASIFALLKTPLVSTTCVSGWVVSNQKRNDGRDLAGVLVEFRAKRFAQKVFFAAHANGRADCEHDDCCQQCHPMADGQTRGQQHAEHSRVNRVAHHTIGTRSNQLMSLNQARRNAPFLAERLSGSKSEPGRTDGERCDDHEQNDLSRHSHSNNWRKMRALRAPGKTITHTLQNDAHQRAARAFPVGRTLRLVAEDQKDCSKAKPGEHHDNQ